MPPLTFWATALVAVLVLAVLVLSSMYSDERVRRIRAENTVARLRAQVARHPAPLPPPKPRRTWQVTIPITSTQELPMPPVPSPPRNRWRVATVAPLVALLLAVVSVGCIPQPGALRVFTNPDAGARDVVLFGDSLGAMAEQPALALWATNPDVSVSYNARGGTEAVDWVAAMANVTPGQCVIYELGTNDISANLIDQAKWNTLAALNELADADRIVALTLNTTGGDLRGWPFDYRTRTFNQFLRDLVDAGTYPNLVLYDWEATSAGQVGWLLGPVPGGDVLHYNAEGTTQFAQALVDAAGQC